jgi:MFS family permease
MDAINHDVARLRAGQGVRRGRRRGAVRNAMAVRPRRRAGAWWGLPRALWLVAAGILANYLGYGAVLPFEVIYLHEGRGLGLGVAGVVVSLLTGMAVLTAAPAGGLIDRWGARAIAVAAGVLLAAGYAGLAAATTPAAAALAAVVAGAGNGALNPAQNTLIATLVPPALRHRATAVTRVAANVGIGVGGAVGGMVAAHGLAGFVALLLGNAVTYLAFVAVLLVAVHGGERPPRSVGGYRRVLADRAAVRLFGINVAIIAAGWGVFTWLVPPYAAAHGVSAPAIGLLLLANAATVAIVQVPVARLAEGRRRVNVVVLAAAVFATACLLVLAGLPGRTAFATLLAAVILVGVGECLYTTVATPLMADLAPAVLRGRYLAAMGLSWWVGLALAPALGAPLLDRSAPVVFAGAAVVAVATGVAALRLQRHLPEAARRTPSPRGSS